MFKPKHWDIPPHIAIIMDGNGRWAKKRFMQKLAGHKAGAKNLQKIAIQASNLGVKYMTVYAFSTENWKRGEDETNDLIDLLRSYIQEYIDDSKKNNMRIKVIGRRNIIPKDLVQKIVYLEELTKDNCGMVMVIALDYGGRDEILRAVKKVISAGVLAEQLTEEMFSQFLDTKDIPDPDILIRTSGEQRISNYLLWQCAYTEFYFTEKLWPDFDKKDLIAAIKHYNERERRYGGRI